MDGQRACNRLVRLWSCLRLWECHVEIKKRKKKERTIGRGVGKEKRKSSQENQKMRDKKEKRRRLIISAGGIVTTMKTHVQRQREKRRRQISKAFIISGSSFLRNRAPQSLFLIEVSSFFVLFYSFLGFFLFFFSFRH